MKRKITKQDLIERIYELDSRTKSWTNSKIDKAILNSFVELNTISHPFATEYAEDLTPYYDSNETISSITLPYSVVSIYDMYLVKYGEDEVLYTRGELKNRNENVIWQNPQDKDTVYFNLKSKFTNNIKYDSIIVKYFYLPINADFTELFLNSDEYVALETALEVAVYELLRDTDSVMAMRKKLQLLGSNIVEPEPTDFPSPDRRAIFGGFPDV